MGIEWRESVSGWEEFHCGEHLVLAAIARQGGSSFLWVVELDDESSDQSIVLESKDADTLEAAKSAAETFAREWVAKQAAALGELDPLAELEALGGYVACSNDAEELYVGLGSEYRHESEVCTVISRYSPATTIPELRAAAGRLVARVRGQVKPPLPEVK